MLLSYLISSDQLVCILTQELPTALPFGAMLFSIDAVGMYSNIDTEHGIEVIRKFILQYAIEISEMQIPVDFVIACLKVIMKRNIFQFGDTFWKQKNGAAMGTSCAVNYAFLYIGLLEMLEILKEFKPWMPFYRRFIDDGVGIWLTAQPGSAQAWERFMTKLNNWGRLKWTTTGLVKELVFMDLTVTINENNCIVFKTFRKEMALNLYLPPNSAHPPDTIRSLVFGRVRAYFLHNTRREDFEQECVRLARNLINSGWSWEDLSSNFDDAEAAMMAIGKTTILQQSMKTRRQKDLEKEDVKHLMVFKLPFHPRGVQRQAITRAYKQSGLAELQENCRFIVAQCRPRNIRDRICATSLEDVPGENPSDLLVTNPIN